MDQRITLESTIPYLDSAREEGWQATKVARQLASHRSLSLVCNSPFTILNEQEVEEDSDEDKVEGGFEPPIIS